MSQPLIRLRPSNDPSNMDAMAYMPKTKLIEVTISGSAAVTPWQIPAGTFIEKVVGRIVTAVSGSDGTIDIGDEDDEDEFIANSEWTESIANSMACSDTTTAPGGRYYAAAKLLKLTFSSTVVSGKVQLLITYWELGSMVPNQSV